MPPLVILIYVVQFYSWLIIAYVILSWVPAGGVVTDIQRALGMICEPYLALFRKIIPPIGMVDISPIVAILVLNVLMTLLSGL